MSHSCEMWSCCRHTYSKSARKQAPSKAVRHNAINDVTVHTLSSVDILACTAEQTADLVSHRSQFVVNSVMNWQPMQPAQQRSSMGSHRRLRNVHREWPSSAFISSATDSSTATTVTTDTTEVVDWQSVPPTCLSCWLLSCSPFRMHHCLTSAVHAASTDTASVGWVRES